MNRFLIAVAALALAACNQAAAPTEETAAAPQSLMDQVQAMSPEEQPVFAYQQLTAYQQAHPELEPACNNVRGSESRGVVPDNVDPESIYAPHRGAAVFSVQCGELISATRPDPREHWLVVFAPGAADATVVNCADARGGDQCLPRIPTVAAAVDASTPTP